MRNSLDYLNNPEAFNDHKLVMRKLHNRGVSNDSYKKNNQKNYYIEKKREEKSTVVVEDRQNSDIVKSRRMSSNSDINQNDLENKRIEVSGMPTAERPSTLRRRLSQDNSRRKDQTRNLSFDDKVYVMKSGYKNDLKETYCESQNSGKRGMSQDEKRMRNFRRNRNKNTILRTNEYLERPERFTQNQTEELMNVLFFQLKNFQK